MTTRDQGAQPQNIETTQKFIRAPDEKTSTAITLGIANVLDCDIDSLRPLGEVLDVEALDAITTSEGANVRLEFEYADCLVTVRHGTEILITPNT